MGVNVSTQVIPIYQSCYGHNILCILHNTWRAAHMYGFVSTFWNTETSWQWPHNLWLCSGRAVQASPSYGPWVSPPPSLQSDAACQRLAGAARCCIKDSACPVSVPCTEKCWSTPPSPPSLHAEKCVTLPLVRGPCAEKCWSTPSPESTCWKVCCSSLS